MTYLRNFFAINSYPLHLFDKTTKTFLYNKFSDGPAISIFWSTSSLPSQRRGSASRWLRHPMAERKGKSFRTGFPLRWLLPRLQESTPFNTQIRSPAQIFVYYRPIPPAKIPSFQNLCWYTRCLLTWTTPPHWPPCSLISLVSTPLLVSSHILNFK